MKPEILKILYCGHEECAQGHAFGPVARSHYLIHFVLKGKGYYQVGDHIFTIEAGSAFLIKPYEVTFYKGVMDSAEFYGKHYDRVYITSLFTFYYNQTVKTIKSYEKLISPEIN